MNKLLLTLIIFCLPVLTFAQTFQMGTTIGFSSYQGDIASEKIWSPNDLNPAISGFFRYNINEQWGFRANFLITELTGDDLNHINENEWRATRALKFRSPLQEITMNLEWKFLNKPVPTMGLHPYIFAGFGAAFVQPVTNSTPLNNNSEDPDPKTKVDGPSNTQSHIVIPFGFGFYYDLDNRMTVGMELSSRKTFTDKLDGISDLGNDKKQDWYTNVAITFAYQFGAKWEVQKRPNYNRR